MHGRRVRWHPPDRGVAPTQNGQSFFARNRFEQAFTGEALLGFHRQETHARRHIRRDREAESQRRAFAQEKFVRDLNQDASAIAGFRIAAAGAAMP